MSRDSHVLMSSVDYLVNVKILITSHEYDAVNYSQIASELALQKLFFWWFLHCHVWCSLVFRHLLLSARYLTIELDFFHVIGSSQRLTLRL